MSADPIYTTLDGDRWDLIAWRVYGDVRLLDRLVEANPSVAIQPVLPAGLLLRIPDVREKISLPGGLPPWKR